MGAGGHGARIGRQRPEPMEGTRPPMLQWVELRSKIIYCLREYQKTVSRLLFLVPCWDWFMERDVAAWRYSGDMIEIF